MTESDCTVHESRFCILEESVLPMKKWTRVVQVNKIYVDAFTFDEYDSFILDYLIVGSKLQVYPVPVHPPGEAEEEHVRGSTTKIAEEQDSENEDRGEEPTTTELTLRRSTRVMKEPLRFEHFGPIVIEDPVTMCEAIEVSVKKQGHKAIMSIQ